MIDADYMHALVSLALTLMLDVLVLGLTALYIRSRRAK